MFSRKKKSKKTCKFNYVSIVKLNSFIKSLKLEIAPKFGISSRRVHRFFILNFSLRNVDFIKINSFKTDLIKLFTIFDKN